MPKTKTLGYYYAAGNRIRIFITDELHTADDKKVFGVYKAAEDTILIDRSSDAYQQASTLLHEIVHASFGISPAGHSEDEEVNCRSVENGLAPLFADPRNRKILTWITKRFKED